MTLTTAAAKGFWLKGLLPAALLGTTPKPANGTTAAAKEPVVPDVGVRAPKQFDVVVTDNLFGDILSDEASMLTGSIGMLPSASLDSNNKGMYEPCHGSAPDIAGQGIANPLATILSVSMMLRYTFNQHAAADAIEKAVSVVLDQGLRTGDIWSSGNARVGTREMGDAVVAALRNL